MVGDGSTRHLNIEPNRRVNALSTSSLRIRGRDDHAERRQFGVGPAMFANSESVVRKFALIFSFIGPIHSIERFAESLEHLAAVLRALLEPQGIGTLNSTTTNVRRTIDPHGQT
jgi:hypothetical protein